MSPRIWAALAILAFFAACGMYVHLRGRVRYPLFRQLTDFSTFFAPYTLLMNIFSAVPRRPILDIDQFPELRPLRDHWQTIAEEAARLSDEGAIRAAEKRNDIAFNTFFRRGWTRFYVKWYGEPMTSARQLCPKTVELVESIPSVNAALFAMMKPQSLLGVHRDPFAGSLRYHLGLITPNSDDCRIYIDGTPYSWRDGQDIIWDETYLHSVRNDTDQTRVILFCDVTRPLHTPVMRGLNHFMIQHVMKISAAQNTEAEQVGILNGVSRYVYAIKSFSDRMKRANRRLFYTVKYVIYALILYGIIRAW